MTFASLQNAYLVCRSENGTLKNQIVASKSGFEASKLVHGKKARASWHLHNVQILRALFALKHFQVCGALFLMHAARRQALTPAVAFYSNSTQTSAWPSSKPPDVPFLKTAQTSTLAAAPLAEVGTSVVSCGKTNETRLAEWFWTWLKASTILTSTYGTKLADYAFRMIARSTYLNEDLA